MVAQGGGGGMYGCFLGEGACVVAPGGACVVALGGWCVVAPGGACMVAPGGGGDTMRYGDTINERAVRILLECILVDMLFPVSRTKVLFVPLPSTLPGRLFIEYVMYMFLLPGVYVTKIHIHVCLLCRGSLLVEAQDVSTWEPAVDTTDLSTSTWKQAGAVSRGRGCEGTRGWRGKGSSREAAAVLSADTGAFSWGFCRTCPIASEQDFAGSNRMIFFLS